MELHYAEVNSYTLFLADCLLEKDMSSIRSFIFSNQADFHRFYQAQRLMMQYNFPDHSMSGQLPFSGEAEAVLTQAEAEMEQFGHKEILPAHLFLAAARNPDSLLYKVIKPAERLTERLLEFYTEACVFQAINDTPEEKHKKKGWFSRLLSRSPGQEYPASAVPLNIGLLTGLSDLPVSRYDTDTDFEKTVVEITALSHSKQQPGSYAIVFKEMEGQRIAPVVAGGYEAEQLFIALESPDECKKLVMGRLNEIINRLGYRVQESVVYGRKSGVFLTRIILAGEAGLLAVEARPSDAATLSIISGTPFTFAKLIFDAVSVLPESPEDENK